MEPVISQLKKDFHARIATTGQSASVDDTIALLTQEELTELEQMWVQLVIWQKKNSR